MSLHTRSLLDRELSELRAKLQQLADLVETATGRSIQALKQSDLAQAQQVVADDVVINALRYDIEDECLRILATQQPAAVDLRIVLAASHVAVELERMGDHAAGIASLVERLEGHEDIDSLHQLPKMARRAQEMIRESVDAFLATDTARARALISRDDKLDSQYMKLFGKTIKEMRDESYVHQATYLLWAGHNLERIGDRATNIAERAIFADTGHLPSPEE